MGQFFAYSIQSAICIACFYLFFKALLSRETFHRFNRIALLGILVLSLTIPCVLTVFQSQIALFSFFRPDISVLADDFSLSGILADSNVSNLSTQTTGGMALSVLPIFYLIGCMICLIYTLISVFQIIRIIRQGACTTNGSTTKLILTDSPKTAPFSWMQYIVLSKSDYDEAGEIVYAHENAHIRLHHSIDLLIAQICIITQWFNPAMWLLYRELKDIHEYEADEQVILKGIDAKQYQLLLIKKAVGTRLYSMANSFNHSNLKKRITMMLQKKSKPWARLKYAYVLPLAAVAVAVFAHPEISHSFAEISSAKISHFALDVSNNDVKNLPEADISDISAASLEKNDESQLSNDSIYATVDKIPEFPGGDAALLKWINDHLVYPEIAKVNGVEGRVSCRFVVEKDGSVTNAEVTRSLSPETDNEALRILRMLPKFKPGTHKDKPVRVRFSVPIRFTNTGNNAQQ